MKKRVLSIILIICMLLTVFPVTASADVVTQNGEEIVTGDCGESATFSLNTETGVITISGTGDMYDYDTWSESDMTLYSNMITSAVIESGITSIGNYAFSSVTNMESITIADTVKSIGNHAFNDCYELKTVTFGTGIETIGNYAFYNCSSLLDVTLHNGLKRVGEFAFYYCTSLKTVTLPDSLTTLSYNMFEDCYNLKKVKLGNAVKTIGKAAFYDCYELNSINFPDTLKSIEDFAFQFCPLFKSITLPQNLIHIGYGAFADTSVEYVTIPESVLLIETLAFRGESYKSITVDADNPYYSSENGVLFNKNKTTLLQYPGGKTDATYTIPASVKTLANSSFAYSELETLTIPDNVEKIENEAFVSNDRLKTLDIGDGVTSICSYAFSYCTLLESLTIGKNVVLIEDSAFQNCYALETLTIPENVVYIGTGTFGSCNKLKEIKVDENNDHFASVDGVLFSKDETELIQYPYDHGNSFYEIPDGTIAIAPYSFAECPDALLNVIVIPESVRLISYSAFQGCNGIAHVLYKGTDEQWQLIEIESTNHNLEEATRHYNAKGDEVTVKNTPTCSFGNIIETGCSICNNTTKLITGDSVDHSYVNGICTKCNTSDDWDYYYDSSCDGVIIDEYNGYDTNLTIPSEFEGLPVKEIGSSAFNDCTTIVNLIIPDGVTEIGNWAFEYCSNMVNVTIPTSVTSISDNAFYDCENVWHVLYEGTEEEWGNVDLGNNYDYLQDAIIHFEADGDEVTSETVTEPTCETVGIFKHTCSVCEEEKTLTSGYAECKGEYIETIAPDCESSGYDVFVCDTCGNEYKDNYVDNIGHDYTSTTVDATCMKVGYTLYECERCDNSYTDDFTDALEHDSKTTVYNNDAGDGLIGTQTVTCNECGESATQSCLVKLTKDTLLTRALMCVMLADIFEYDQSMLSEDVDLGKYTDIDVNAPYIPALKWCLDCGFIGGTTNSTVNPLDSITRAQMAVILKNSADKYGYDFGEYDDEYATVFDDVLSDRWYTDSVSAILLNDVMTANGTKFYPDKNAKASDIYGIFNILPDENVNTDIYKVMWENREHVCVYDKYVENDDATCTSNATATATCSCGSTHTKEVLGTRLDHNFEDGVCSSCGKNEADLISTSHPYECNMDQRWTITKEGAKFIAITFSEETYTEPGWDYIYVYEGSGELGDDDIVGKYSGDDLSGKRVVVYSDSVTVRFTSDSSSTFYGFDLIDVTAYYEDCKHDTTEIVGAYDATCSDNGYTGDTRCTVCNYIINSGEYTDMLPHNFVNNYCYDCGTYEWYWDISDGYATITNYYGNEKDVVIPSMLDGHPVKYIGEWAFQYDDITSVTIPEGVTHIQDGAFASTSLESVTFPSTIESIGWLAFEEAYELETVNYHGTPMDWENVFIFTGNDSIKNAQFNYIVEGLPKLMPDTDNMTMLDENGEICFTFTPSQSGTYRFKFKSDSLIKANVHGVSYEGYNFVADKEVEVGKTYYVSVSTESATTVKIENVLLQNATSLEITDGDTLTVYEGETHWFDAILSPENSIDEEIYWSKGDGAPVVLNGNCAHFYESGTVTIFAMSESGLIDSITVTVKDALELKSKNTVTVNNAGESVIYEIIPETTDEYTFDFSSTDCICSVLYTADEEINVASDCNYTISETLEEGKCYYLKLFYDDPFNTGSFTFSVSGIEEVVIPDATYFDAETGILHVVGKGTLWGPGLEASKRSLVKEIVVYKGITNISANVFNGANFTSLEKVTLPEGLTSLGKGAFTDCQKLKEINLPSTLTSIGEMTFYNCKALTKIDIPASVTSIGNTAFLGVVASDINFAGTRDQWDAVAVGTGNTRLSFVACSDDYRVILDKATKGDGAWIFNESKETLYFAGGTNFIKSYTEGAEMVPADIAAKVKYIDIDETLGGFGAFTFSNMPNVIEVTGGENIRYVGNYAFKNCVNLTKIELTNADYLAGIAYGMFAGCTSLESVEISDSIVFFYGASFKGCTELKEITVPGNAKVVGEYTFQNCTALETITLEEGITTFGAGAIQGCSALKTINFPTTLSVIGAYAFYSVPSTITINFAGTQEQWTGVYAKAGNATLKYLKVNCK